MDFKFSKDSVESRPGEAPQGKKSQSALLVLLLILLGGFAYLYFFTGLIKPLDVQKTAETPPPPPKVTKMPLPPRTEGVPPESADTVPDKAEKTAPPATAPTPATAAAPVIQKQLPITGTTGNGDKTGAKNIGEKKPAEAVKSVPAAKKARGPRAKVQGPAGKTVKAKKVVSGPWSLVIGNYVLEEALSADLGHVRKAGFKPVVKPSSRKQAVMSRLFISEFTDRTAAYTTLEKLKRYTSDAFIIGQGNKYSVYAGSYVQNTAALSEKERLKGFGFSGTIRHATIAIPSQSLTVGPFENKQAATAALKKLNSAGIKAALMQK